MTTLPAGHGTHLIDIIGISGTYSTDIQCPHCHSHFVTRKGSTKTGSRRGQCKNCNKTFIIGERKRQHFPKGVEYAPFVKNWAEDDRKSPIAWRRDMNHEDHAPIRRGD